MGICTTQPQRKVMPLKIYAALMLLANKVSGNLYVKVNDDQFVPIKEYFWLDSIGELKDEKGTVIEQSKED